MKQNVKDIESIIVKKRGATARANLTVPTVLIFPILVVVYVRLAKREEFGNTYR